MIYRMIQLLGRRDEECSFVGSCSSGVYGVTINLIWVLTQSDEQGKWMSKSPVSTMKRR